MKTIASALVKAQKAFGPALKSSSNPHFRSKYADLAACVEAVIEALNDNGIYLMQPIHEADSGVIVETLFIHESGETLSAGRIHVPAMKNDPQAYGSSVTYGRRYSLMAACGIAPEDDDGNAASRPKPAQKRFNPEQAATMLADLELAVSEADSDSLVEIWKNCKAWREEYPDYSSELLKVIQERKEELNRTEPQSEKPKRKAA